MITLPHGMDEKEKEVTISYGNHTSANKEAEFVHLELAKQVKERHVAVSPLETVNALHNLWLSLVAVIPQVGSGTGLI